MTKEEYFEFAKKYKEEHFDLIRFNWNCKHGDDFIDTNYQFRIHLCEAIKDDLSIAPDQLILDLYQELAKAAKETFGVYNSFHIFANELLLRGGVKYFDVYCEGAFKSMDTTLSSGRIELDKKLIQKILSHIKARIKVGDAPRGYEYMEHRFEWLLNK